MYNRYFGFKENPFSIAPDPRFLFMSEMHQDALAHLDYGVSSDGCIVLLTGEIGTGKTTICRCFLEQLDEKTDVAVILNPKLSAVELLATICDEFRIPVDGSRNTTKHYIDHLNRFLLRTHAQNRRSLLVIDEAQNLDKDVLEMVRLLTNLETNKRKLLKVYLLGQSELSEILAQPDMTQINQRITGRFHLRGLQLADMEGYIRHRITTAGGGHARRLFDKKAIRKIHRLSGGIPRLINNLCDRSLLGAYTEEKECVDDAIVKKAAVELLGRRLPTRKIEISLRTLITVSMAVLLVVVIWLGTTNNFFHNKLELLLSSPQNMSENVKREEPEQILSNSLPEEQPPDHQEISDSSMEAQSQSPEPEIPETISDPDVARSESQQSGYDFLPDNDDAEQVQNNERPEPINQTPDKTNQRETRIVIKSMEVTK